MGAAAAVAILHRRERDLVAHFRRAGALSPATAQTSSALGVEERLAWVRLANRAVIRSAPNGAFYLDEQSWGALIRIRRRLGLAMLAVVIVAFIYFAAMKR